MKANVGSSDRLIRLVVAAVAIVLAFAVGASSALGIVLWIVAAIMALTAVAGFCPLYRLLGLNTCPVDKRG